MPVHSLFIRFSLALLFLVSLASSYSVAQEIPDEIRETFMQGQTLIQENEFEEAADIYREITKSHPDFEPGWFFLGYTTHMCGNLEEALKINMREWQNEDFATIAHYNIACAHSLRNNREAALDSLEKAVEMGFDQLEQIKNDEDLYSLHTDVRFAKVMAKLTGKESMIEQFDKAEELVQSEDFAGAAEIYRALLEKDSRNDFVTYRLGYTLHGAGDLDGALEMHSKAARLVAVAPVANYNIACVHSLKDDKDQALTYLEKAVDLGFVRMDAFQDDPDLENVRSEERFKKLVSKIEEMQSHDHEGHEHGDDVESDHDHDGDDHEGDKDEKHDKDNDGLK